MAGLIAPLRAIGEAAWLLWRSIWGVLLSAWRGDSLLPGAVAAALARFLWRPLPTICALSALSGLIVGVLAARLLELYNLETLIVGSLADAVLRQALPLVIGVFAAGGVAVDLATRLGAMHLAGEIEALEGMGHDPAGFVLGPLAIAVLAASPLHMALAASAALLAAGLPITLGAHLSWLELAGIVLTDRSGAALLAGFSKVMVFNLLAFLVGSVIGARPVRVPADIAWQGSRAFMLGLLMIFAAAALWVSVE